MALLALLMGLPLASHAAEAPGALTIIVNDVVTERPVPTVQLTLTERETGATQSVQTDSQGRTVIEQLDPGLYSVNLAKDGFISVYEPSIRVVTRKNTRIEFELREAVAVQEVVVQGRQADAYASASSTYLDREALRSAVGGGADPLLSLDGLPGLDDRHSQTEASPGNGYGLGLGIVERLCERNGWTFTLHADEVRVAARLSW